MKARDFSSNRSNGYQHVIMETPTDPETLTIYSDSCHFDQLRSENVKEMLLDLREQLFKEFWRVAKQGLTKRQYQVLELMAKDKTQMDIAKILKVNQSSVTKSFNGNTDYKNGKKVYGGARKKLEKMLEKDPVVQEILLKITELQEE